MNTEPISRALSIRTDLHLSRKFWHLSMGVLIVAIYVAGISQMVGAAILGVCFLGGLGLELYRLKNARFNEIYLRSFGILMRSHEVHRLSGMPYYLASAFFSVVVFPKPIAVLALLFLAVGDPVASLAGILFSTKSSRFLNGSKSLHGSAAAFLVCAALTWWYVKTGTSGLELRGLNLLRFTLLGGFAGSVAELLPLDLDDNLTIPIVSGLILWVGLVAIHFV